jgi:hypothetical protein
VSLGNSMFFLGMLLFIQMSGLAEPIQLKRKPRFEAPHYYIITIAANDYKDPLWPKLKYPESDASQIMKTIGRGSGFKRVMFPHIGKKATLKKIFKTFKTIKQKVRPQDVVVVYVSSHGTLSPMVGGDLSQYIVLPETNKNKIESTALSHGRLRSWLSSLRAKKRGMILATCFSGVGKSALTDRTRRILHSNKGSSESLEKVSEGVFVLAAAAKAETAREHESLGGDVYTHFLLEGGRVFDRNQDGQITASEAHDYALRKTFSFTKGRQTPTLESSSIGNGDIPFTGKRVNGGLPILEGYSSLYRGQSVKISGQQKGSLPFSFPLEENKSNLVKIYAPGANEPYAVYSVRPEKGEVISVDQFFKPPPYRLGFSIGTTSSNSYDKVGTYDKDIRILFTLFKGKLGLGLGYTASNTLPREIRSAIQSQLHLQNYALTFTYSHKINSWIEVNPSCSFGFEKADLILTDLVNKDEIELKKNGIAPELSLPVSIHISGPYWGFASLSLKHTEYDFGSVGRLSGSHLSYALGVHFNFNSKFKRLK